MWIWLYTCLKGSNAKSNGGLCSGLRPRDLATSAASLGLIENILLMSARVYTLLLGTLIVYMWGSSLINLLEHMHDLSMLISENSISNRGTQWVVAIPIYVHTIYHVY